MNEIGFFGLCAIVLMAPTLPREVRLVLGWACIGLQIALILGLL